MRVLAPNGLVLDVPPAVASGLVGGRDVAWSYVTEDAPAAGQPEAIPAAEVPATPKPTASKAAWAKYATEHGDMTQDQANGMTKAELINYFT